MTAKPQTCTFFLDQNQIDFLRINAAENNTTPSAIVRDLLDQHIGKLKSQIIDASKIVKTNEGFEKFVFEFITDTCSGILVVTGPKGADKEFKKDKKIFGIMSEGINLQFNLPALEDYNIRKEN